MTDSQGKLLRRYKSEWLHCVEVKLELVETKLILNLTVTGHITRSGFRKSLLLFISTGEPSAPFAKDKSELKFGT